MPMVRRALAAAFAALGAVPAARAQSAALITIKSPPELSGCYPSELASFGAQLKGEETLVAWSPGGEVPGEDTGCDPYSPLPQDQAKNRSTLAIVRRGNCSFLEKGRLASLAGASGLVVVNTEDTYMGMGTDQPSGSVDEIFLAGLQSSVGDRLLEWTAVHGRPVILSVAPYEPGELDASQLFLLCLATATVAAGAFMATADLRQGSPFAPQDEGEVKVIDSRMALGFFILGSVMLVVLYFTMRYLIYFILFGFSMCAIATTMDFGSATLGYLAPALVPRTVTVPRVGTFSLIEILCLVPGIALAACWFFTRKTAYGWIFQDIIGVGFLCFLQRTFRMPNIKVATVLLVVMFFFDIFWTFLSPFIFPKSVMVAVATGGGSGETVPMLFRVPVIGDPFGHERMLGFGDIGVPGLLVSYLRRHDTLSQRRWSKGYFAPALLGYFCGLCITVTALSVMRMAQPALLWLVPCTLGSTLLLARARGEIKHLWAGVPARNLGNSLVAAGAGTEVTGMQPRNDEGAAVARSSRQGWQDKWYCGRPLGMAAVPGSADGVCGPLDGPQCGSCMRFQVFSAPAAAAAAQA